MGKCGVGSSCLKVTEFPESLSVLIVEKVGGGGEWIFHCLKANFGMRQIGVVQLPLPGKYLCEKFTLAQKRR